MASLQHEEAWLRLVAGLTDYYRPLDEYFVVEDWDRTETRVRAREYRLEKFK